MPEPIETSLIADLARDTVQRVAPQELPRFRATSQAYFEDPDRVLKGAQERDQMLGFGAGQQLAFLTPVALAVATQVVTFVTNEVTASLKEESPAVIREYVRKIFGKLDPKDEQPAKDTQASAALTPEQLARVRQTAFETARRWNLAETRAALLADSLVGSLAVRTA